ncbi:MAG: hypothetical protein A3C55_03695 [Gammaproteobacteria bacterium RIFCSPHIGHO2_02_FULL_42_13]|nr:MAG: hypothetical protein A3C55_03695 [Gammaproteobacteria bacterium RIFCSPHIGHO2_02_FULL_42_13]
MKKTTAQQISSSGHLLTLFCCLLLLTGCAVMRPNIEMPATPPPPLKLNYQPQVAVVLGGGGARGYAHIGVLKVLHDAGVPINLIAGTSAGSLIGALYADTANPTDTYNRIFYTHFWKLADIGKLNLKGIMTGYHLQRFLLTNLNAHNFNQLKIPLIVATTDLTTGKTYVISNGPIAPAVQASSAIPGVFLPVHLYGHILVDGGVSDSIPVNVVNPYHPKVIIAVNISPQLSQKMPTTATGILERSLLILREKASAQNLREANITIRPQVGQSGAFDLKDKHQLYDAGIKAAQQQLPNILKLLKEKNIPLTTSSASVARMKCAKHM